MSLNKVMFGDLTWIDIVGATPDQIKFLGETYNFHPLLLEDCMSEVQRSKVDEYDDYVFLVLHFPRYYKHDQRLSSEEVDIFLGKNYLVTVHDGELKPLVDMFNACINQEEIRQRFMNQGSGFLLYEIVRRLFNYCFPMLDKIGGNLGQMERTIFKSRSRTMLEEISRQRLEVIGFRKIIKPLRPVIKSLELVIHRFLPEDLEVYFDDITDQIEKIWDFLENYKEVVEALLQTFEANTSFRINNLMRIFTVISVIILPMTLIQGFFSMNVEGIPWSDYPFSFWITIALTIIPAGIIALVMLRKRNEWL
ncbi:MAG TPA: magnesium transporter CorA family protein [Bacillota bacterium]|nr:magnesium transporter CorA family protein [Bacillota bacterium]